MVKTLRDRLIGFLTGKRIERVIIPNPIFPTCNRLLLRETRKYNSRTREYLGLEWDIATERDKKKYSYEARSKVRKKRTKKGIVIMVYPLTMKESIRISHRRALKAA